MSGGALPSQQVTNQPSAMKLKVFRDASIAGIVLAAASWSTFRHQIQSTVDYWRLPRHMQIALGEMHQRAILEKMVDDAGGDSSTKEIYGVWNSEQSNPRIKEYLRAIGVDDGSDIVGYCAGFAVWSMNHGGAIDNYPHTNSSYLWDALIVGSPPKIGDVVNMQGQYKDPVTDKVERFGHISFYYGSNNDGTINILGGNQRYEVNIKTVSSIDVLGYVPVTYAPHDRWYYIRKALRYLTHHWRNPNRPARLWSSK
jgi:hypothetical protein